MRGLVVVAPAGHLHLLQRQFRVLSGLGNKNKSIYSLMQPKTVDTLTEHTYRYLAVDVQLEDGT